jgi:hypothetical protein
LLDARDQADAFFRHYAIGGVIGREDERPGAALYTTPVVYLYLDRLRLLLNRQWRRLFPRLAGPVEEPSE